MVKLSMTVCDVCKSVDKPTESYRITHAGKVVHLDLCSDDAGPLLEVIQHAAEVSGVTAKGKPGRKPSPIVVTTMEEIEQRKRNKS